MKVLLGMGLLPLIPGHNPRLDLWPSGPVLLPQVVLGPPVMKTLPHVDIQHCLWGVPPPSIDPGGLYGPGLSLLTGLIPLLLILPKFPRAKPLACDSSSLH